MYLIDTNICIYAINGRHPKLTEHLLSIAPDEIFVSSVTVGELEYGAAKSRCGERTRLIMHAFLANFKVLPFTEEDAVLFGKNRALIEANGTPVGVLDVMIGSQGVANDLTVVTHNKKDFELIPGIRIEDWAEE